ncbi:MAG: OmpA family protein [Saprospiraceae bacterium]
MSKLLTPIVVLILGIQFVFSQSDTTAIIAPDTNSDSSRIIILQEPVRDTVAISRNILTDTVTDNSELALWKSGKAKYPPKPNHAWELGLHSGIFLIDGDVDQRHLIPGFGYGIHLRRAIHYIFSVRVDGFYGVTYGCDPQPSSSGLLPEQTYTEPGGEVRDVFRGYGPQNPWFANYKLQMYSLGVQGILNVGNILFHKPNNKWNWYLVIGATGYTHKTMLNLRDQNNNLYNNLIAQSNYPNLDFNTRSGRQEIKKNLNDIYDNTYETEAYVRRGIFRFNDRFDIHLAFTGGVGIARKINRRFNIALEHLVISSDNDYLDGIHWRTDLDQTNNNDIGHYTNLRLAMNLGNLKKKTEPLYWLNPLDAIFTDISELKQRPKFDLKDTDQDGVIDMIDQEVDSPAGAPVDTRGITLDSDMDGIPDHKDEEPFSAPGYQVNEKGIAQVPVKPQISEDDVKKIVDQKLGLNGSGVPGAPGIAGGQGGNSAGTDWFLPMIHYNLDEYCVKPQYYTQLHHVAMVMKSHPNLKVTAYGHTDIRADNAYNNVLSYNRAKAAIDYLVSKYDLPRERFILMYGGEDNPLGPNPTNHYINRRVEFQVSTDKDKEMPRPDGPEAGDCHKKRLRKAPSVQTDDGTAKDKKSGY